jgi:hypothetical protein
MDTKTGFFEEAPGVKSSTRLNSFLLLIFFCVINTMWVYGKNPIDGNILMLDMLLLLAVFAPKYLHKVVEAKINKT